MIIFEAWHESLILKKLSVILSLPLTDKYGVFIDQYSDTLKKRSIFESLNLYNYG